MVDDDGLPIAFHLTPGQRHDIAGGEALLVDLEEGSVVLADKAYDSDALRAQIEDQGAAPNIPDKSNRKQKHCFSKTLYKLRNKVERFFNRIKNSRRIATRYDKLAENFLAMIKLASIRIWIRHNESAA